VTISALQGTLSANQFAGKITININSLKNFIAVYPPHYFVISISTISALQEIKKILANASSKMFFILMLKYLSYNLLIVVIV
jgi:hypothetical protein